MNRNTMIEQKISAPPQKADTSVNSRCATGSAGRLPSRAQRRAPLAARAMRIPISQFVVRVNACAPSSAIWRSCALAQANSSTAARSAGMTAWPLCAGADAFPASMSTSGVSSRCSRCSRARSRATGRLLVDLAPLPRYARPHLSRISGARKSVVAVTGVARMPINVRSLTPNLKSVAVPITAAVFSVQHLFCFILGNAILGSRSDLLGASL
jgi:hypothetical protein